MTILRDISFLWSMLHVVALFLLLFQPRYSWRTTLIAGFAGAGVLLVVNVLAMYWLGHGIIMSIAFFTCTIPSLVLFFVLSKYRDGRYFFLFCLTDTVCFWLLQATNFLDRLAGGTYLVLLVSRLILFPLVELIFWRYLRRPYLELQEKQSRGWWTFTAIGAVYYLLIMATCVPVGAEMPDTAGLLRILLVMALMPLTYLTILHSLWQQMQIYENRWQIDLQRQNYNAICQKLELGRIYRHDMRHHLIVLDGMLRQGDTSAARQYVGELSGKLASLAQTVWCANTAVNAVLAAYFTQAEETGCQVKAEVRVPAQLPYGEMDLCIILANTLENAIRACWEVPQDKRLLRLKLELTDNQRLTLFVENACSQLVTFGPDGLPVTSQSGSEHGLGLPPSWPDALPVRGGEIPPLGGPLPPGTAGRLEGSRLQQGGRPSCQQQRPGAAEEGKWLPPSGKGQRDLHRLHHLPIQPGHRPLEGDHGAALGAAGEGEGIPQGESAIQGQQSRPLGVLRRRLALAGEDGGAPGRDIHPPRQRGQPVIQYHHRPPRRQRPGAIVRQQEPVPWQKFQRPCQPPPGAIREKKQNDHNAHHLLGHQKSPPRYYPAGRVKLCAEGVISAGPAAHPSR